MFYKTMTPSSKSLSHFNENSFFNICININVNFMKLLFRSGIQMTGENNGIFGRKV